MMEYPKQDHQSLGDYYLRHVSAMTAEGLHAKSDIAAQLAWRDKEIDRLRAALAAPAPEVSTARHIKNLFSLGGAIDAAFEEVLKSNEPDAIRACMVSLAHEAIDVALAQTEVSTPSAHAQRDAARLMEELDCFKGRFEGGKRLLCDIWEQHPEARTLIEKRTGNWFVLGVDRDAAPQPLSADARDAARYRIMRRGQHWSVIGGSGCDLSGETLDIACDAAIASMTPTGGAEK